MGKKVLSNIVSVDSTPDVSHGDQMTFIVRFVDPMGKPVERFLKFIHTRVVK